MPQVISFRGYVRIKVISADCTALLSFLNLKGIQIIDIQYVDDLSVRFCIRRRDYKHVKQILKQREEQLRVLSVFGAYWNIKKLYRRPVLVFGVLFLLFLVLYLPTRILFVGVVGNDKVPTNLILDKAESCGITFGVSRESLRSEKIKNRLLESVPELQWVGVNSYGCFAVISVEEKSSRRNTDATPFCTNIVAARDGVITEIAVTKGTVKCEVGQSVKKGQVLVSGYADHGFKLTVTGADAEIFAQTGRSLIVTTPSVFQKRMAISKEEYRYSLILGKKLINFSKDSGILGSDCVRIYTEYYIVLPGGYQLPLGIAKEQRLYYSTETENVSGELSYAWVYDAAESYLTDTMVAGETISKYTYFESDEGVCRLYGTYRCREMIGRMRKEVTLNYYEQRN